MVRLLGERRVVLRSPITATGIYAIPEAVILKFNINLNRVLHIYLVSKRFYYEKSRGF